MNKSRLAAPLAALTLSACVVAPTGRGHEMGVGIGLTVPALPLVVELRSEPHHSHGGYIYCYDSNGWRDAPSRPGPWVDLPRSHYPKETRYRDRPDRRDRDRDRDRAHDRDSDRRR